MDRCRVALLIVGAGWVATGCELVAGIQDLAVTPEAGVVGPTADGASTSGGSSGFSSNGTSTNGSSGAGTTSGSSSGPDGSSGGASTSSGGNDAGHDGGASSGATTSGASSGTTSGTSTGTSSGTSSGGPGLELIDNMEADTGLIPASHGRSGTWFVYNDMSAGGTQTPSSGTLLPTRLSPAVTQGSATSNWASQTSGSGFASYAGMGFNINDPPATGVRATYDAHTYTGFLFYAKVGSGSTQSVRFNVPTKQTDAEGGVCTKCSDHFGVALTLSTSWQPITVPYSMLMQQNFGLPQTTFDPTQIYGCQFQTGANASFDVWIDDIYFTTP